MNKSLYRYWLGVIHNLAPYPLSMKYWTEDNLRLVVRCNTDHNVLRCLEPACKAFYYSGNCFIATPPSPQHPTMFQNQLFLRFNLLAQCVVLFPQVMKKLRQLFGQKSCATFLWFSVLHVMTEPRTLARVRMCLPVAAVALCREGSSNTNYNHVLKCSVAAGRK